MLYLQNQYCFVMLEAANILQELQVRNTVLNCKEDSLKRLLKQQ